MGRIPTKPFRRGGLSSPPCSPRSVLGLVMVFFVVFHTFVVKRTLETRTEDESTAPGRHDRRRRGRANGGGAITTSWHEDWKLRRTQTAAQQQQPQQDAASHNARKQTLQAAETVMEERHHTPDEDNDDSSTRTIRAWGANLTTTPLIYVHIGKAGGGTIRARFSSARPTFEHADWRVKDDDATYPVATADDGTVPAYFCNSGHATFRSTPRRLYEETLLCHATTPLGAAIACPEQFRPLTRNCPRGCSLDDEACHLVYMGHNIVGAEWHWLPHRVLRKWWQDTFASLLSSTSADDVHEDGDDLYGTFDRYLATLTPSNPDWCPYEPDGGVARPDSRRDYMEKILTCEVPLAHAVDNYAHRLLTALQTQSRGGNDDEQRRDLLPVIPTGESEEDWSFLYASLPVLRTTIIREPWSWLVSKFFWQGNWHWHDLACDNITEAVLLHGQPPRGRRLQEEELDETAEDGYGDGAVDGWEGDEEEQEEGYEERQEDRRRKKHPMPMYHPDSTIISDTDGYGWATRYAMLYIFYLCGEDCAARWEMSSSGYNDDRLLAQLEQQAANNLRRSFAVVGLLHETDTFFDMVTARVQYIDMSIHADVEGELHDTGTNGYIAKCKERFRDPDLRQKFREASPAVAALERLYDVAVQVNRFQVQELASSPHVDPDVRQRLQKAARQF